jgi:hypothetical protein
VRRLLKAVIAALLLSASAAQAGTYQIAHGSTCPLMDQPKGLYRLIDRVGIATGLDLQKGFRISGSLLCFYHQGLSSPGSPVYVYTYRVTIDKEIRDAGATRWATLHERTSYGATDGDQSWVNELEKETRTVIELTRRK